VHSIALVFTLMATYAMGCRYQCWSKLDRRST